MPDASDFLRTAQANVVAHSRRAMRFSLLTGCLTAAVAIMAFAANPHVWWLAAVFGASFALNAHTTSKAQHLLASVDASAVRWWMRPAAYVSGAGSVGAFAWALWQFAW